MHTLDCILYMKWKKPTCYLHNLNYAKIPETKEVGRFFLPTGKVKIGHLHSIKCEE